MFVPNEELENAVLDFFRQYGQTIAPSWKSQVAHANSLAYTEIVSALTRRGYSISQIMRWDRGKDIQLQLGKFWALMHLKAVEPENESYKGIKEFDCREYLYGDNLFFTAGGVFEYPANSWNLPSAGPEDTSTDLFVPINPDDSRIGDPSEF